MWVSMAHPDWLNIRKWPHPQYGNYGGAFRHCYQSTGCPVPRDKLDGAFRKHDNEMRRADPFADPKLVYRLLTSVSPLRRYYRPIYGRVYHLAAIALFGLLTPFTVGYHLLRSRRVDRPLSKSLHKLR